MLAWPLGKTRDLAPPACAGVTLLELMTVVMIVGILSADRAYRATALYVMRAHRTDAKNALLRIATNQERFYLANRTLRHARRSSCAAGFPTTSRSAALYALTITVHDATTFTATATRSARRRKAST